ncbi:MAG: hypothetical protein LLG14_18465 [Nocardiaceae bacterium]|nr:hypothetical protein [Nocardiaceae bacterium]
MDGSVVDAAATCELIHRSMQLMNALATGSRRDDCRALWQGVHTMRDRVTNSNISPLSMAAINFSSIVGQWYVSVDSHLAGAYESLAQVESSKIAAMMRFSEQSLSNCGTEIFAN